eukprot:5600160-Amphidinium_carterae.2
MALRTSVSRSCFEAVCTSAQLWAALLHQIEEVADGQTSLKHEIELMYRGITYMVIVTDLLHELNVRLAVCVKHFAAGLINGLVEMPCEVAVFGARTGTWRASETLVSTYNMGRRVYNQAVEDARLKTLADQNAARWRRCPSPVGEGCVCCRRFPSQGSHAVPSITDRRVARGQASS